MTRGIYAKYHYKSCYYLYKLCKQHDVILLHVLGREPLGSSSNNGGDSNKNVTDRSFAKVLLTRADR